MCDIYVTFGVFWGAQKTVILRKVGAGKSAKKCLKALILALFSLIFQVSAVLCGTFGCFLGAQWGFWGHGCAGG